MDEALVVLCTAPDAETGARLARGLVESKLAACVNVVPGLRSFYTWEGQVQDDPEVQLLIKTRRGRLPEVERWLGENHPYDVPEVLALPVAGGAHAYLSWVDEETR
ncbi:MAG: divalent-cation tolerance protein CutA [Myxococcota bacterium]